jgi:transposase-like protein
MNTATTTPVVETEVTEKAKRRRFTAEYKKKILEEADRCAKDGELGALLRREGLYSSNLAVWRKAVRERGEKVGLEPLRRGPKLKNAPKGERDVRLIELERRNARLQAELARARAVIEVQKKVSELLGLTLPKSDEES